MTHRVSSSLLSLLLLCLGCSPNALLPAPLPATEPFGKASGRLDSRTWFRPERESQIVAVEAGVAGDRVSSLIDVPESSCAIFIARGTATIQDLDLLAYGEDGAVLGMDEGTDATPALLVCPPHPARIYVAGRIASGHGLVALGVERVPPEDADRVASTYHVRQPGGGDAGLAAWPGLTESVAEHRRRLGGTWTDVRRVAMPLDARLPTRLSASIAENRCLHALLLPNSELSRLELSALDERGHILGRAMAFGRDRSLVVCASVSSAVTFEIRPQDGRGVALLVLAQSDTGDAGELDDVLRIDRYPNGTLDDERARIAARLNGLGYAVPDVIKTGVLEPGHTGVASFLLPKGCSRIDVLTAAPVRELDVRLWGADDSLIADDEGRAAPVLFACSAGSPARLDIESLSLSGPFSVELRREPEPALVLQTAPLAASRLLGHLYEHGLISSASQAGRVTRHDLSPDHLASESILVPLARCIDVTLAIGASAAGAEVRLLDANTGEELAIGRGNRVASARACALGPHAGGTLHARAELRVRAGQGVGLSATRLTNPAP